MYTFLAITSIFRLFLWFFVLYGFIAPLLFPELRKMKFVDRLILSWVGIGGIIMGGIVILTSLHMYDLFSMAILLLGAPLFRYFWTHRKKGIMIPFRNLETSFVNKIIKLIELRTFFTKAELKKRLTPKKSENQTDKFYFGVLLVIILAAGAIRIVPSIENAAPFTRLWYQELIKVKHLNLQDYFFNSVDPLGMHSLINVASAMTQVSPEMMLHLFGSIVAMLLTFLIWWVISLVTFYRTWLALMGAAIYAIVPTLLTPLSLELQIESNTIDFALCFAIPTAIWITRFLRLNQRELFPFILAGFIATGLSNLFVLFIILIPFLITELVLIPSNLKGKLKLLTYSSIMLGLVFATYITGLTIHDIELKPFFLSQLYSTSMFSYSPGLILPLESLSAVYFLVAVLGAGLSMLRNRLAKRPLMSNDVFLFVTFAVGAFIYLPIFNIAYFWVDIDQLNAFYSFLIPVMLSLFLYVIFSMINRHVLPIFKWHAEKILPVLIISVLIFAQGGITFVRTLPTTMPNGFFEAYYEIIAGRLAYSYATVSPEIDRNLALNRHFFMNYEFFLNEYGTMDSLYHQYLNAPKSNSREPIVPPSSIFIFVENPNSVSIGNSVLYNAPLVMQQTAQWVESFSNLPGRKIEEFYRDESVIVYELVNKPNGSKLLDILFNTDEEKKP